MVFTDIFGKSSSAIINTIISQDEFNSDDIIKNIDRRCKSSHEDILNAVTGISFVDAQKERMLLFKNILNILINLLNLLRKLLMFLLNLMNVISTFFVLYQVLIDVPLFLLLLK